MKKLIYLIPLVLVFTSCEDNIINSNFDKLDRVYVVNSIQPHNQDLKESRYFVTTGTDLMYYDNGISFIDRNGKFAIGDTINVSFNKNSNVKLDSIK